MSLWDCMRTDVYRHVSCIALHDIIVDHVDVCKALQSTTGLDIVLPGRRRRRKKRAQHFQTIPKVYIVLRWQHQFWKTRSFYVHSDLILLWTITDSSEAPGKPPTRSYWVHPYPLRTPRLQHDVCKLLQPRSVVCLAYAYAFCYCLRRLSRYWLFFTMSILVRTRWSFFLPAWPGLASEIRPSLCTVWQG